MNDWRELKGTHSEEGILIHTYGERHTDAGGSWSNWGRPGGEAGPDGCSFSRNRNKKGMGAALHLQVSGLMRGRVEEDRLCESEQPAPGRRLADGENLPRAVICNFQLTHISNYCIKKTQHQPFETGEHT